MLGNLWKRQDVSYTSPNSVVLETPLVASPNQTMRAIQVSRKKLYELINAVSWRATRRANLGASQSNRLTTISSADWPRKQLAAAAVHPIKRINPVLKRDARLTAFAPDGHASDLIG
jgi:hypothetical protein